MKAEGGDALEFVMMGDDEHCQHRVGNRGSQGTSQEKKNQFLPFPFPHVPHSHRNRLPVATKFSCPPKPCSPAGEGGQDREAEPLREKIRGVPKTFQLHSYTLVLSAAGQDICVIRERFLSGASSGGEILQLS